VRLGQAQGKVIGCPWTLLMGEVDMARRKQSVTEVCNCFLGRLEALG